MQTCPRSNSIHDHYVMFERTQKNTSKAGSAAASAQVYLPTIVFIGPSLLWFSGFFLVLAGTGHNLLKIALNHDPDLMFFFYWEISQLLTVPESFV